MKNQTSFNIEKNELKNFKTKPLLRKKHGIFSSFGLVCLALLSINAMDAQETKNQTNITKTTIEKVQDSFVVKGNVSDDFEAIPGVNILLEGTDIGTSTDFDGNFEFPKKLKKGDVLVFSYVGLESKKLTIENQNSALNIPLDISMRLDPIVIMGEVAVKEVYKSKRSK